jgi:ornithine cyclodeaminase/alanine dehydrogenase-like protein (mu-crystallin family)
MMPRTVTHLALMDSIEITIQRTGAATAVAAKYLARPESETLTICGAAEIRVVFLLRALRNLFSFKEVFAYDLDEVQAQKFAQGVIGRNGGESNDGFGIRNCG